MEGVFLFLIASGLTLIFGCRASSTSPTARSTCWGRSSPTRSIHWIAAGTPGGVLHEHPPLRRARRPHRARLRARCSSTPGVPREELMQLVLTLAAVTHRPRPHQVLLGARRRDRRALPTPSRGRSSWGTCSFRPTSSPWWTVGVLVLVSLWAVLKFTRAGPSCSAPPPTTAAMVALLGINQAHVFTARLHRRVLPRRDRRRIAAAFESVNYLLDARSSSSPFIVVVIGGLGNLYGRSSPPSGSG